MSPQSLPTKDQRQPPPRLDSGLYFVSPPHVRFNFTPCVLRRSLAHNLMFHSIKRRVIPRAGQGNLLYCCVLSVFSLIQSRLLCVNMFSGRVPVTTFCDFSVERDLLFSCFYLLCPIIGVMWSVLFANAIFVRLFASCVCVDSPPLCHLVAYPLQDQT